MLTVTPFTPRLLGNASMPGQSPDDVTNVAVAPTAVQAQVFGPAPPRLGAYMMHGSYDPTVVATRLPSRGPIPAALQGVTPSHVIVVGGAGASVGLAAHTLFIHPHVALLKIAMPLGSHLITSFKVPGNIDRVRKACQKVEASTPILRYPARLLDKSLGRLRQPIFPAPSQPVAPRSSEAVKTPPQPAATAGSADWSGPVKGYAYKQGPNWTFSPAESLSALLQSYPAHSTYTLPTPLLYRPAVCFPNYQLASILGVSGSANLGKLRSGSNSAPETGQSQPES